MFWEAIISGILGSMAMLVVLYVITFAKIANADMVRALGSLATKTLSHSIQVGLLIYFTGGIIFSFLYFLIFRIFPLQEAGPLLFLGAYGGFIHGLIISFALVIEVAGRHPVEQFSQAGYGVALAHIVGHVVYGGVLAFSYIRFFVPTDLPALDQAIGPIGIYALVLIIFGIVLTAAAAVYTKSHESRERRGKPTRPAKPGSHI